MKQISPKKQLEWDKLEGGDGIYPGKRKDVSIQSEQMRVKEITLGKKAAKLIQKLNKRII